MNGYTHHELLPLGKDETPYRLLTTNFVSTVEFEGREILKVETEAIKLSSCSGSRARVIFQFCVLWTTRCKILTLFSDDVAHRMEFGACGCSCVHDWDRSFFKQGRS